VTKAAMNPDSWERQNRDYLADAFSALAARLTVNDGRKVGGEPVGGSLEMDPSPAIDMLTAIFGLSNFERELLLLLAGVEMHPELNEKCAQITGQPRTPVNFSLAMSVLSDPHWSALAPSSPLRRFRLIEMESGYGLTSAPLRVDERILHYIAGLNELDERLAPVLRRKPKPEWITEEHFALATETIRPLDDGDAGNRVIHLRGDDPDGQESVAAILAHSAGLELMVMRIENTPASGPEMEQFLHLWMRESLLIPALLLLQWGADSPNTAASQLAERISGPLFICTRNSIRLHRPAERYEVNKPGPAAQKQLWKTALQDSGNNLAALLDEIAEQFHFSAETIVAIRDSVRARDHDPINLAERLWSACRSHSRNQLDTMAERILTCATWDDLILPEQQLETLHQLVSQSRHRLTVYETWGFAAKGRRGLGICALFSGPSGTGKTLAAEVLAHELELDLYRIDLSAVVSKYIGETEKNLKQVFDAAECGGVVLLFDEADALFGKRADVKDSHDRYANIEVSYLLQRMENFQGLAILTTNLKSALDQAFQRRLRFCVEFPFPDAAHRQAIWRRVFPAQTPTDGLRMERLAALNVSGGNIRNIAMNAAFLAAANSEPVGMGRILKATQIEAVKLERPIADTEVRGWL
jgi:ATPase family associated with various cellular activities (AAA)